MRTEGLEEGLQIGGHIVDKDLVRAHLREVGQPFGVPITALGDEDGSGRVFGRPWALASMNCCGVRISHGTSPQRMLVRHSRDAPSSAAARVVSQAVLT